GVADVHGDAGVGVLAGRDQREVGGALAAEVAGEVDTIVGELRLFAESDDVPRALAVPVDHSLEEAVSDHSVADHDQALVGSHLSAVICGASFRWGKTVVNKEVVNLKR